MLEYFGIFWFRQQVSKGFVFRKPENVPKIFAKMELPKQFFREFFFELFFYNLKIPPNRKTFALVIDEDDDFFATAERLSQPTQGLLGLDGPVTPLKIELDRYLSLAKLPKSNVDVLALWKDHQQMLPLLSEAARKYLCVTASSASAERLFSASGKVVTPMRSSLDPANVDKRVYLHENLKEVDIKYDFSLNQRDQAEPADPDDVVVVD